MKATRRQLQILNCIKEAIAEKIEPLNSDSFLTLAMQFGKKADVTKQELQDMLRQPLYRLLDEDDCLEVFFGAVEPPKKMFDLLADISVNTGDTTIWHTSEGEPVDTNPHNSDQHDATCNGMSPCDKADAEEDEPPDTDSSGPQTYSTIRIYSHGASHLLAGVSEDDIAGTGPVVVRHETNDNNDDGYSDPEVVIWFTRFKTIEDALKTTGRTRRGAYGQPVEVYLDDRLLS